MVPKTASMVPKTASIKHEDHELVHALTAVNGSNEKKNLKRNFKTPGRSERINDF